MKNLRVGTRILLSFCAILSFVLILSAVLYTSNKSVISNVDEVAVNNMFSVAANNLLEKSGKAHADASVFFLQRDDNNFSETLSAIEQTQAAFDELNSIALTYPQYLSAYESELLVIDESISACMDAVKNVNEKRVRQDELRGFLLYYSRLVHKMYDHLCTAYYNKLESDAAAQFSSRSDSDGQQLDISTNLEQINMLHELSDTLAELTDSMIPLLYQNNLSYCDEIMNSFDEYYEAMSVALKNQDVGTTRSIAVGALSYLDIYRKSLVEYCEGARQSEESINSADTAQDNLQLKSVKLVAILETVSRARIERAKSRAASTLTLTLLGTAAALTAGLLLAIIVTKSITEPVEKMVLAARRLAMGDTDLDLGVSSTDEVGKLALQMQEMIVSVKEREKALSFKAEHDLLTGLYNKVTTSRLVNQFLIDEFSNDTPHTHALFFIDLDNFKPINDILGHEYGDKALVEFADRLRAFFRSNDIIGRVGGDEFVALVKNLPDSDFAEKRASQACKALTKTYREQERDFVLSCSIGVCFFSAHGSNYEELSKSADSAMYAAKRCGKGTYYIHK